MTLTTNPTIAQYGEDYALASAMHHEIYTKVHWFSDMHPLLIPIPGRPSNEVMRNPVKHTLGRDGDWMYCIECNEACETGTIPKRPLTPMEASISGWD